ncbi:hypothetical protein LZ31DRAFT_23191 [Colletotrichum somersetense]|nr:hypothetical protein LZ31DRAFT_23191 [Colletotrichum somersetense]
MIISADGLIQERGLNIYEEQESGHRCVFHLFGLYPGDDSLNLARSADLASAAERVLERRAAQVFSNVQSSPGYRLALRSLARRNGGIVEPMMVESPATKNAEAHVVSPDGSRTIPCGVALQSKHYIGGAKHSYGADECRWHHLVLIRARSCYRGGLGFWGIRNTSAHAAELRKLRARLEFIQFSARVERGPWTPNFPCLPIS